MAKISCSRRLHFCAGHRVVGHEGKCRNLHGHNYVILIEAESSELDHLGRVVDFGVLKARIGEWLETHWDHACLISNEDHELRSFCESQETRHFVMPCQTTAENIALYLLQEVAPRELSGTGVTVTSVRVWETENCFADARL